MGVFAAGRALRVAIELQFLKLGAKRVEREQTPDEWFALFQNELDGFAGLKHADDAGQNAQHARLRAAWRERHWRRLRIEAAIAGTIVGLEDGKLAFKAVDAAMYDGLVGDDRSVIQQIASREVIGAVNDEIILGDQFRHV